MAVADAEKKSLGSLRLQEKDNVVRGYEAIGAKQDEFIKDWNKTTGKALNVVLAQEKLSKWSAVTVWRKQGDRKKLPYACIIIRAEFARSWGANPEIFPYAGILIRRCCRSKKKTCIGHYHTLTTFA